MKYYKVVLEGIDKSGKDVISNYITYLSNYKYITHSRDLPSMIVYSKKYNRNYIYDLNSLDKTTVYVFLKVNKIDWEIRCKFNNEPIINYEKDTQLFEEVEELFKNNGFTVFNINTSEYSPYIIANHIIEFLNDLNGEK